MTGRSILPLQALSSRMQRFHQFGRLRWCCPVQFAAPHMKVRTYHGLKLAGTTHGTSARISARARSLPQTLSKFHARPDLLRQCSTKGMLADFDGHKTSLQMPFMKGPSPAHGWMKSWPADGRCAAFIPQARGFPSLCCRRREVLGQQGTSFGAFPDVVGELQSNNGNSRAMA